VTRPVPAPSWRTVAVSGARVRLLEAGTGEPLLFLHGWGLGPASYVNGLVGLCQAGVRVLAPGLPGFSGSDGPPLRAVSLDAYADRVAALLDTLDLGKPVFVVGHSFGGGIAIRLATRRPDLVRSLTLVNSVGGAPGPSRSRPVGELRAPMDDRSWARWWLSSLGELSPRELLRTAPVTAGDLLGNLRRPLTAVLSGLVALRASLADEATALVDSGMPVLFVWGDRDRLITPGALSSVAGDLPPEVVRGRHGWLLSSPREFADLLVNALVVHAMLERKRRGQAATAATALASLLPVERRRQARHSPLVAEDAAAESVP
jgi:pimeloyl-ACP methyl ester carboxylesterase